MEWYEEFRMNFPATLNQIYVNMAYFNPLPTSVVKAMNAWMEEVNQGVVNKEGWKKDQPVIRDKLSRLVNCKPHEIAFPKNTCEGLNIVAQSLRWNPGDNVVVNDQENLSNVFPWLNLRQQGVEVRILKARDYRLPVDHIMSMVDTKTKVVAVSYVQYGSGFRADLESLGSQCHATGARLIVDGIQGIGVLKFDAKHWNVDAMACGGHKGLLAPIGVSFLFCKEDLMKELRPAFVGPSAATQINKANDFSLEFSSLTDARRLEYGNLNYVGLAGLKAGLELLEKAGIERIEQRVLRLSRLLDSGLRELGYRVISPSIPEEQSSLVVLILPDPDDFYGYLREHNIVAMRQKLGTIRFSFHAYNNDEEVYRILEVASGYEKRWL
jgi:selenocysteine lyase/cysteine desulfurase